MAQRKKNIPFKGIGIITAIAASLCCITPVLAFVAGIGSLAAMFSWMEPLRPYIISLTILALSFAWYQKIRSSKSIECNCETDTKNSFWQSKMFLGTVTIFAVLMVSFPYYAKYFYPNIPEKSEAVEPHNLVSKEFIAIGMTCTGCEEHIKQAVSKLPGISSIEADYKTGKVVVKYDKTKLTGEKIGRTINSTGYKVKE